MKKNQASTPANRASKSTISPEKRSPLPPRIVQIIPATGWFTVWEDRTREPIACWSLTNEGHVAGMINQYDGDDAPDELRLTRVDGPGLCESLLGQYVYLPTPEAIEDWEEKQRPIRRLRQIEWEKSKAARVAARAAIEAKQ
jgi:hypothetical protein